MTESKKSWLVGGATVRGASHVRRGLPNQDAVRWAPTNEPADHCIAAVADGHGAPAHSRSQEGSRLAVETGVAVLDRFLTPASPDQPASGLAIQIVTEWRQAVLADAGTNAAESDWVEAEDDKLVRYGSTLIVTAFNENLAVAVQIGDGDLYWVYPDGRVEKPLPDDVGLVGEQTYSLCMPGAEKYARTKLARAQTGQPLPCFAMLSTDGVAKSFADDAAFRDVVRHYYGAMLKGTPKAVLDGVPGWLETVSQAGSGDDATICLAILKEA